MTCAICRFYEVCIEHGTLRDCTQEGNEQQRSVIMGW